MASIIKRKYKGKKGVTTKYYISYRDITGKQHTVGGKHCKMQKNI